MNVHSTFARDAAQVQSATQYLFCASVLNDLIADWSRLHMAMSLPGYSRETERAYYLAEWRAGKAYARLFQIDDPENVDEAADVLKRCFNYDPVNDCVFDEGAVS